MLALYVTSCVCLSICTTDWCLCAYQNDHWKNQECQPCRAYPSNCAALSSFATCDVYDSAKFQLPMNLFDVSFMWWPNANAYLGRKAVFGLCKPGYVCKQLYTEEATRVEDSSNIQHMQTFFWRWPDVRRVHIHMHMQPHRSCLSCPFHPSIHQHKMPLCIRLGKHTHAIRPKP